MKATPARIEKQRRLVEELRRRLTFETLVLERLEGRGRPPAETRPATIADVLERTRRRDREFRARDAPLGPSLDEPDGRSNSS